jgi:hypothetical protein
LLVEDDVGQNSTQSRVLKVDVANILQSLQLELQPPPVISSVSTAIKIVAWTFIGIGAFVQLTLLFLSVRYRNESVMRMAQGNFLIVLQVAALFATICSFLFDPISDMACLLVGPLTLIPMQLVLAILYGRLLRIVTLMGSLMAWNQPATDNAIRKSLKRLSVSLRHTRSRSSGSISSSSIDSSDEPPRRQSQWKLRKNFPAKWLIPMIAAVTFPQVLAQIIVSVLFPRELEVGLNADETAGRYECGYNQIHLLDLAGPLILIITMLITLSEAYKARDLPALFSETSCVSAALITIVGVTLVASLVVATTHIEMDSPDLQYLMQVLIVVNFALNLSVRVLVPKFRMIWKGEKIVVSQILADHVKQRNSQISNRSHVSNPSQISNRSQASNGSRSHGDGSSKMGSLVSVADAESEEHKSDVDVELTRRPVFDSIYLESEDFKDERDGEHSQPMSLEPVQTESKDFKDELVAKASQPMNSEANRMEGGGGLGGPYTDYIVSMGMDAPDVKPHRKGDQELLVQKSNPARRESKKVERLRLQSGCAPPQELTVNVVQLHRQVAKVNDRILSGLVVSEEDWLALRKHVCETQRLMKHMKYYD